MRDTGFWDDVEPSISPNWLKGLNNFLYLSGLVLAKIESNRAHIVDLHVETALSAQYLCRAAIIWAPSSLQLASNI
jgi:hypothetical protein